MMKVKFFRQPFILYAIDIVDYPENLELCKKLQHVTMDKHAIVAVGKIVTCFPGWGRCVVKP